MDNSFQLLLPSPKKKESKVKSKLDQLDKILKNMNNYNTTKVDIEKLNRDAKLEAKKSFYEEIDGFKLVSHTLKSDQYDIFGGFNKICSQINRGLAEDLNQTFKNKPFLVFKKADFYDSEFNEKSIRQSLAANEDKLKMFKIGLKMISIESNLDNILVIKKILIDAMVSCSIVDIYATFIKILINWGINLDLLDQFVIKYRNIKDNASLKRYVEKAANDGDYDLNLVQSFVHIIDIIEIATNTTKIDDQQILADYVSIILILHSNKQWRFNLQCLDALSHLFTLILKRMSNSASSIKLVSKTILKYFKDNHEDFIEFLDFFPDNTSSLANVKFALCKIALKKYKIKVGHTEQRVNATFDVLKELKRNSEETRLVIAFIDHFFKTRELSEQLSQQISECFALFTSEFKFDSENQNSTTEFQQYLNGLIENYDTKPKKTPIKKKIKGAHLCRPRKVAINSKEIKKIWEEIETEVDLN